MKVTPTKIILYGREAAEIILFLKQYFKILIYLEASKMNTVFSHI